MAFNPNLSPQVSLLIAAQVIMIAYLVLVRPFHELGLQIVEVVCHGLECVIFFCAMTIGVRGDMNILQWLMIGE